MINDLNEVNWCYLLDPTFELINSAGKPLTDGWIEVYIHGTRSKYYCASDFDGTLHPFKIPLDSLGANIILASPAHAYDVYVYNKYGSLIMSRYNVVPATGDAEVVTDTTTITSNDGTVQVASSDQTNWDLSIADTIAPVTAEVDEHDRQLTQIEHDISDINDTLSNKKNKQDPYVAEGGVTKTITRVEQDRNGNLSVTYSDIDLPPEVPTVEITSPNGTIQVASSIDVETNTKTFEIDVKNGDPVWHYWTGNNAWTQIATKSWTQINRPAIGAGSNPHPWNPDIKRGIFDAKAHFTVTFHNYENSKTVPNQIIQVGFRAKFVGKNDPTAIRYEDLGAWTYDPSLYTTEAYQYNFAQESLRQNHDTSKIINVANYWGDTDFNVYFEAALLNTDGSQDVPSIDTVLFAEITYFGYHEVKGAVQAAGGGGREYSEGSGIDITNDAISVKAGEGLTFVENKLTVDFDEVNAHQVQSDWNQTASAEPDFIKNKPVEKQLVEGRNIHITDTGTAIEISSDSDPQVQSDWNEADVNDPAYIKNKPDLTVFATKEELGDAIEVVNTNIATAVDVVETHLSSAVDIIEQQINEIPSQVQSDWTENDSADPAYIQHKPAEKTLKAGAHITITDVGTAVEIASEGEPQVQSDWTENDSSSPAYIQHKPNLDGFATKTELGSAVDIIEQQIQNIPAQVQSNWNESDSSSPAYIQNKPDLTSFATVTDLGSAVDVIEQQIQNIPPQEQSDWTEADSSDPAFIKNKPSICPLVAGQNVTITDQGSAIEISATGGGSVEQVQADWSENDSSDPAYIKNKPDLTVYATNTDLGSAVDVLQNEIDSIPAQVQSDWTEDDPADPAYIQNKPSEKNLVAGAGVTISETNDDVIVETTEIASGAQLVAGSGIDIQESNGQVIISSTGGSFTQVQSNWNESDTTSPAFILNKPTIPEDRIVIFDDSQRYNTGTNFYRTNNALKTTFLAGKVILLKLGYRSYLDGPVLNRESTEYAICTGANEDGSNYPNSVVGKFFFTTYGGNYSNAHYDITIDLEKTSWQECFTSTYWSSDNLAHMSDIPSTASFATKTELASAVDVVEAEIPANTSDLNNDSGFITSSDLTNLASKTDLSSAVDVLEQQISNIPAQVQSDWNESDTTDPAYIENKPTTTPLIAGQSVTITDVGSGIEIDVDTSALATKTELASAIDIVEAEIPANTSDLQNDSGFITSSAIPDLEDLNTAGITDIQVVNALPASPVSTVLYLVRE